jgi:hypothetical protein
MSTESDQRTSRQIDDEIRAGAADLAARTGLSREQAYTKIIETKPELYTQYRRAHKREIAKAAQEL